MSIERRGSFGDGFAERLDAYKKYSFDLDEVCVDTAPEVLQALNKDYGTSYTLEDFTDTWITVEWFKILRPREDPMENARRLWNRPDILENAKPTPGFYFVMKGLNRQRIIPFYTTARPGERKPSTCIWFNRNHQIKPRQLIMQKDGWTVDRTFKTRSVRDLGIDVHFEDNCQDALDIAENTDCLVVLVGHPWNRNYPKHPRIIRPEGLEREGSLAFAYLEFLMHVMRTRT